MTRELATFPAAPTSMPAGSLQSGRYELRFARSEAELDGVLRLRYRVFNLELAEGLALSALNGRDEDEFDRRFHHLLITEGGTVGGEIVGTYRMQTGAMAERGGYYSSGLFALETLPRPVLASAVEIGRACVARPHRNGRVLHLLWRGLAQYLSWNRKHILFGCCSLTSQDEALGTATHRYLLEAGAVHREFRVDPQPGCACADEGGPGKSTRLPTLFRAYLDMGAKVLGPPAIDRAFGTIDWLVLLDVRALSSTTFRSFFR